MDTISTIRSRRSIKFYDPDYKIPEQEIDEIIDLALLSPSSFNTQGWRIVNIEKPEMREKIKEASWNQPKVTEASHLFAICADINAWNDEPSRYWHDAPEEVKQKTVPLIKDFYKNDEQLQRDEAIRSVGIISQTIMLACKAKGYDSCPMIGFEHDKVAEIIKLPDNHLIGMLIVVGKAAKSTYPRCGKLDKSEVYLKNSFQ